MAKKTYDYVIVGAGSAGCVLANRLTEDPDVSVLLVEAGGSDKHIFIAMPTALSYPMNMPKFSWQYHTENEPFLDDRSLHCPRGKVLGGSSSINGMVYVRGHAEDFNRWAELGAQGWDYAGVLPYFKKAETWMHGGNTYRGGHGPVAVNNGNNMQLNPLYRAFIDAGVEAGYAETEDYNGFRQEGFGPMHMTVVDGKRCSTSLAYLRPALHRNNLTLLKNQTVTKVLLENDSASGIECEEQGRSATYLADREVLLCAGAIGSPQLLMVSGIGPEAVLEKAGVQTRLNLSGVGQNLIDHLEVYFQYQCPQPVTLNGKLDWFSKGLIGAQWLLTKTGLGATNHFESCAFIRSRSGLSAPDIQYHFLPAAMRYDGRAAFKGHGFQVHVGPNKPKSRGHLSIRSANILTPPRILFNYLQSEQDRADWRRCIRLTREILQQPALAPFREDEIQPGLSVDSDAQIDQWVRQNVESAYHPCGTCKMGLVDDAMSVVDSECRVIGVRRLRVVDASVFPDITNGNLNAPTIMLAERAASLIRNEKMKREDAPVWLPENYQTQQR